MGKLTDMLNQYEDAADEQGNDAIAPAPKPLPEPASQAAHLNDMVSWIFNGSLTITNRQTDDWRTFRIKTQDKDAKFAPRKRIIGLLSGPDNQGDYLNFGFVDEKGIHVWTKRKGKDGKASHYEAFATMIECIHGLVGGASTCKVKLSNFDPEEYEVLHEGRCIICNRPLTTPESVRAGIGPVCAGRSE